MKALSLAEAKRIFYARYWRPMRLDEVDFPCALMAYNCGVNSGPSRGARFLQEALRRKNPDVVVDGKIGPKTIAAANGADQAQLVNDYSEIYEEFYRSLPTFSVFGKGWMNRLRDVAAAASDAAGAQVAVTDTPDLTQTMSLTSLSSAKETIMVPEETGTKNMTTIDRALGGEIMTGKKTLISVAAAVAAFVLKENGFLNLGEEAFNSIMAILAGYGGLGALSKIERYSEK